MHHSVYPRVYRKYYRGTYLLATREKRSYHILLTVAYFLSSLQYMNKWAYVYVGLYGFSYIEAGRNVIQLFQQRGWTSIITDDLTDNVLFMMSVAVGLACGLVGLVMGCMDSGMFQDLGFEHAAGPSFVIGLLVGILLSSILFAVVGSAVNTVIVCYAEAPAEFQMNHPQLAADMRSAWVQAWPALSI
jgi:hypothetical protein